jgi:hypothetical protein
LGFVACAQMSDGVTIFPTSRKRDMLRMVLWILIFGVAVWAGWVGYVMCEIHVKHPATYEFTCSDETELTEALALDYTKQALRLDGEKTSTLQPIRYRMGNPDKVEVYLDRQSTTTGGIRWDGKHGTYDVRIAKDTGKVACTVWILE